MATGAPGRADSCPLCKSERTWTWKPSSLSGPLESRDLSITDHRYGTTLHLLECECGFRFAAADDTGDLLALYAALDDPEYEQSAGPRRAQQRALLRAALRAHPGATSLLDVGAANGLLVEVASDAGLEAVGVEPSEALAASARSRGVDVATGVLGDDLFAGRRFDLVTLVDVVEHVTDPVRLLASARERLAEGGRVLVVTPDAASVAARLLRGRWWHLRTAHVGYFTRATLTGALARSGLVPERWWRPGWVFELRYLFERLGEYVPLVRTVTRRVAVWPALDRVIPLNLYDSIAVLAVRGEVRCSAPHGLPVAGPSG